MKTLVVVGGRLAIICTVAALVLALVNAVTEPRIEQNQREALERGLLSIAQDVPVEELEGDISQEDLRIGTPRDSTIAAVEAREDILSVFPIVDDTDQVVAYELQLVGAGYGGDMNLLAGYLPDGTLFAATLMENQETPGLGKKAEDPDYMTKFIGRGGAEPLPMGRSDLSSADADAVTGATITFVGVATALAAGSDFVVQLGSAR